uniref:Putative ecdysteroid kinase n=1 Tax=Nyssomyia neivai TaxID=330878 RepID=A0A1L8DYM0_9DIPT
MAESTGPSQFSKDELTPPDFLNQQLFLDILRDVENDKALMINEFAIIPGTKPGDHFASIMFKAIITYSTRGKKVSSRSFVIKTMPVEEGFKKEMFIDSPIFDREIQMYTKVLPEMKRIMESIGDYEEIVPKLIYYSKEPVIIVFEDITQFGYEMHQGFLDFDNTAKIAKKLAKFHALSFYMHDNKYVHNFDFPQYGGVMFTEKNIDNFDMFIGGIMQMCEEVKTWEGFENIAEKLGNITKNSLKSLLNAYKPNPEPGFNVLCHSDFHIKNMMFIKKNTDLDKILLLDFQMCFWGTPALDVLYLFYVIGNASVRMRRGEMMSIYHTTFTDYLSRLGCLRQGPTLLEMNIELLKLSKFEAILSLCMLPFFSLDFTKVDAEAFMEPTPEMMVELQKMMYKSPPIVELLKEVLPQLYWKGALE